MAPCSVDPPTETEKSQAAEASLEISNFFHHSADILRELLLSKGDKTVIRTFLDLTRAQIQRLPNVNRYGDNQDMREQRRRLTEEYNLAAHAAVRYLSGKSFAEKTILKHQIAHRRHDVQRLIKTFADSGDFKRIEPLLRVDFSKPLREQIGYDPHDY